METLALYLLKSATWLTGFAVIYFLFLRNERFFLLKRIYLISGIIISFVFPLISFHYQVEMPVPDLSITNNSSAGSPVISVAEQSNPGNGLNSGIILLSIYLAGVAFLVMRALSHVRKIFKTINRTEANNFGDAILIRAKQFPASFSFFNYVFINPEVNDNEAEQIINHELVHVKQKHWLDLLLVEILRVVQWINPFAWLYSGFIKLNHEYLADHIALQKSVNPAIYQAALVNQIMGAPVLSLSNTFNYSLNKKRFDMMKNIISSPYRKMRVILILPVFVLVFYAFAEPEYKYSVVNDQVINSDSDISGKEVKGIVQKNDGSPFAGVQILIAGTSTKTITDASGNFILQDVPKSAFIVFSYAGYLTQVQKAEFTRDMNIKLLKDPDYKEEIAVISYGDGTQPIRIRPGNLNTAPESKPLLVLDGAITNRGINEISPNMISNISVIKGQKAIDLYGEKGNNGVLIITTKSGFTIDTLTRNEQIPQKPKIEVLEEMEPGTGQALPPSPILVIDDVISTRDRNEVMKEIGDQIASINRLTRADAVEKYGDQGKNGAMEIMTRKRAAELGIKVPFRRMNPGDYPTFQGKPRYTFQEWVMNHITYPQEAIAKGISGTVRVDYTIEADGKISSVICNSNPDPLLGDAMVAAIQSAPAWEPPKNPEANEPWKSSLRLKFELPGKVVIPELEPFVVVEQMPVFPGGDEALLGYIAANISYPDSAATGGVTGRVIIRFVINTQGLVEDVTVLRGVHPLLDAEAIRVVKGLPPFNPGYQGGKPVPVYYMVPITFTVK